MSHQNVPANDRTVPKTLPNKASVRHDFSTREEEVTIIGQTATGLVICERPKAEGGDRLLFRFDEKSRDFQYVPF